MEWLDGETLERRQVDLFCYCAGDSRAPCAELSESGIRLVLAEDDGELVPPQAAAGLPAPTNFSPFDKSRMGPHKYFVGEVYSGHVIETRVEKVRQLETELAFLCGRFCDRTNIAITDVTQLIGAAALVFPVEHKVGSKSRAEQFPAVLKLVRAAAGPVLQRLMRAGRLLLVLLTPQQAPASFATRELAVGQQEIAAGMRLLLQRAALPAIAEGTARHRRRGRRGGRGAAAPAGGGGGAL